jgi:hypothetical protein
LPKETRFQEILTAMKTTQIVSSHLFSPEDIN